MPVVPRGRVRCFHRSSVAVARKTLAHTCSIACLYSSWAVHARGSRLCYDRLRVRSFCWPAVTPTGERISFFRFSGLSENSSLLSTGGTRMGRAVQYVGNEQRTFDAGFCCRTRVCCRAMLICWVCLLLFVLSFLVRAERLKGCNCLG